MELREEIEAYLEEEDENLEGIEADLQSFFSQVETRQTEISTDEFPVYEWVPLTKTIPAQRRARNKYERWYNSVEALVYGYLPRRLEEFEEDYTEFKKLLNLETGWFDSPPENPEEMFVKMMNILNNQQGIAEAIPNRVDAEQFRAKEQISGEVEKDELKRANQLFNEDLIRESGVIAGVALERRLLTMCELSEREIDYEQEHGIDRLAQSLYESGEISKSHIKRLKYLGSLRGECAHPGEEPEPSDVRRLLNDTEDFIRNKW
jgi:hypothetical protein